MINNDNRSRLGLVNLEYEKRNAATKINYLLLELTDCKETIKRLKKKDISLLSEKELSHFNKTVDLQQRKKKVISQKLSKLGLITDRRGRPKKKENEKYKLNHVRMTCYFTPENIQHMKELKEQGNIDNISSFLNELIDSYFSITKDGDVNE